MTDPAWTPATIADGCLTVWKGGGWQLCLAILAGIAFYRKPWFRDSPKG